MVKIGGDTNGFGWTEGESIGVQLLTVPIEQERRSIYELVAVFLAMLVVLFLFVSVMVTVPLQSHVIRPLQALSDAAERSSLRKDYTPLPETSAWEIQRLSVVISRLRTIFIAAGQDIAEAPGRRGPGTILRLCRDALGRQSPEPELRAVIELVAVTFPGAIFGDDLIG